MTENEVTQLDVEMLNGEEIPKEFEVNYLKETLEVNIKEKYKLISLYKIYRHLRDDEKLKAISKDLKLTKELINYIETKLNELGA